MEKFISERKRGIFYNCLNQISKNQKMSKIKQSINCKSCFKGLDYEIILEAIIT